MADLFIGFIVALFLTVCFCAWGAPWQAALLVSVITVLFGYFVNETK